MCESGRYHFDNRHASVTFGANNAFHYPPHTRNSQRRMPMTTEQWEHENQDTLMEYFIDGDPSVRRIQCEHCRKIIYTQTRNRKYCSFQTCGHKMLNLRKSIRKRIERGTYTCPCCGEQFLPIRADARYCSNACRQKDYRQRKTKILWQLTIFVTCQISCFSLRNLIKIVKFLTHATFLK